MIACRNWTFRYAGGGSDADGLREVTITVTRGQCVLLTGVSGGGKTTLTRCMNGVIPHMIEGAYTGEVMLGDQYVAATPLHRIGRIVGSVFQDPRSQFFATTVMDELAFGCENYGVPRAEIAARLERTVERFQLAGLVHRSVFELSSGERQRLALAAATMLDPDIYVLDEPSANLDAVSASQLAHMLRLLKREGKTVVIAEHRFEYLGDLVDRALYINRGQVAAEFDRAAWSKLTTRERIACGLRLTRAAASPDRLPCEQPAASMSGNAERHADLYVERLAFQRKGKDVVRATTFAAKRGDIIGITGDNGAGKTTLCTLLCGLEKETAGAMMWEGRRIIARRRRELAYLVMQDCDFQLFAASVEQEMRLGMKPSAELERRIERAFRLLRLGELRERHPASLSGGQKQRVSIAVALARDTPIILLDEPTSGMDGRHMRAFAALLHELAAAGKLIIVVSHDREFIDVACSRVWRMDNGVLTEQA